MAWESSPWMIGNGVEHTVEVARLLAHAGTGGAEGIVTPGDLKVQPLNVPGTKVRIAPGAVLLKNRYPGGGQQTYVGRNTSEHEVSITATGSGGGRSDLVVARVLDPQYEGQEPVDPNDFDYMRTEIIEDVPSSTKRFDELGLNYPAVALARIDLPASTGTIESSHITDLRSMAQPRKERHLIAYALEESDGQLRLTSTTGAAWPKIEDIGNTEQWYLDVPEWAERVRVLATWNGVFIENTPQQNVWGRVWAHIGAVNDPDRVETPKSGFDTAQYDGNVREAWAAAGDLAVPAGLRGRRIPVYLRGRVDSGTGNSRPVLRFASSVSLDIEFYEDSV